MLFCHYRASVLEILVCKAVIFLFIMNRFMYHIVYNNFLFEAIAVKVST